MTMYWVEKRHPSPLKDMKFCSEGLVIMEFLVLFGNFEL